MTAAALCRLSKVPIGSTFTCVLALILTVGCLHRFWSIDGLLAPVRISGGSMAPALIGEHAQVTCADCRIPFVCDGLRPPELGAICPNCGYRQPDQPLTVERGQRVLIDRFGFWTGPPRRWDLAAFTDPDKTALSSVKRIVGMPHEQVAIEGGELYINGQLVRKSWAEFRQLAVLVHDDTFRPRRSLAVPSRWQPADSSSRWTSTPTGYACHLASAPFTPSTNSSAAATELLERRAKRTFQLSSWQSVGRVGRARTHDAVLSFASPSFVASTFDFGVQRWDPAPSAFFSSRWTTIHAQTSPEQSDGRPSEVKHDLRSGNVTQLGAFIRQAVSADTASSNEASSNEASADSASAELPHAIVQEACEQPFDWLLYKNWRCYGNPLARTDVVPVSDHYGYNQAISRQTQRVTDLMLSGSFELQGSGCIVLAMHDGRDWITCLLSSQPLPMVQREASAVEQVHSTTRPPDHDSATADRSVSSRLSQAAVPNDRSPGACGPCTAATQDANEKAGSRNHAAAWPKRLHSVNPLSLSILSTQFDQGELRIYQGATLLHAASLTFRSSMKLEFGLVDEQVVLAIEGVETNRWRYIPSTRQRRPLGYPVALACSAGLNVEARELRIHRDLYYLDPWNTGQPWSMARPLGPEQWLLLGDNVPVSRDGRHWSTPGLEQSLLTGRILRSL